MKQERGAQRRQSERRILLAGLLCATAVPFLCARHLSARVDDELAPALSAIAGVPVEVGSVRALLTGGLRIDDLQVGDNVFVGRIEAYADPSALLDGGLEISTVELREPRLRVLLAPGQAPHLPAELSRLAARLLGQPRDGGDASARGGAPAWRVVVEGGDLVLDLGERGELRARGVDVYPQGDRLRAVTSWVSGNARSGAYSARLSFPRAAAELTFPDLRVERLLASGGEMAIGAGDSALTLSRGLFEYGVGERGAVHFAARHGGGRGHAVQAQFSRRSGELRVEVERLPLHILQPLLPSWFDGSGAELSGVLSLWRERGEAVRVALAGALRGAHINHPRLARASVPLDAGLEAAGSLRRQPGGWDAQLASARVQIADLGVELSGRAQWTAADSVPARLDLAVVLPRTPCAGGLAALPAELLGPLATLELSGTAAGHARVQYDRDHLTETRVELGVDGVGCKVEREAAEADPRALLAGFDHTFPDGSRARVGPDQPGYVRIGSMPDRVSSTFVITEDSRFLSHPGFDMKQIERSLADNVSAGRLVRGGSTISQQLVKNVFLRPERTFARKLQEALITWRVESHLSKRDILERYLNIVELSAGIYGLGAGAKYWFGKTPGQLTPIEVAFLAGIVPAPRTYSGRIRAAGGVDPATAARVDHVLEKMRKNGLINDGELARALSTRLVLRKEAISPPLLPMPPASLKAGTTTL